MALLTRQDVKIEVDDKTFALVVSELGAKQSEEIQSMANAWMEAQRRRGALVAKMKFASNEYDANAIIMQSLSLKEKVPMALEQKRLNSEVRGWSEELERIDASMPDLEAMSRRRLELMVEESEQRTELERLIETSGLTYTKVATEISKRLAQEKEKN
ncbi:MAG: hypothetical protein JXK05_04055 [Campylobacterales bacterium]|nr:hypothetical protein [Campylobacterales bacterium]